MKKFVIKKNMRKYIGKKDASDVFFGTNLVQIVKIRKKSYPSYMYRPSFKLFENVGRFSRKLTSRIKIMIYKSIIQPHIDYCSSIIGRKRPERLTKAMENTSRYIRTDRRWEAK
jgi:hypothetical protein